MNKANNKIDTLSLTGEVQLPLVILIKKSLTKKEYLGFVPGLTKKDVVSTELEDCKTKLKEVARSLIKIIAKENKPFPFFPSKEEILQDFENVCYITFIKIKSQSRKS